MLESPVLDTNLVGRKQACRTEFCPVFAAPNEQKAFNSSDIYTNTNSLYSVLLDGAKINAQLQSWLKCQHFHSVQHA